MDNKKEMPFWKDDDDVDAPLRRPISSHFLNGTSPTLEESVQSLGISDSHDPPKVEVTREWNVDVVEFYPAAHSHNPYSVQGRLEKIKRGEQSYNSRNDSNDISVDETAEHLVIYNKLQDLINILIEDPGQFDVLFNYFIEVLAPYYLDDNLLHDVAKLIFSEAVAEPNFRYSAARLCKILEGEFPFFKTALHLFADNLVEDIPLDSERDLTLTLAELFAQSDCDEIYGGFVIKGIEKLIFTPNQENIKCACQVLKLTGILLDMLYTAKIDSIFKHLELTKSEFPSLTNLIEYVTSLRSSHWGQADTNSPLATNSAAHVEGPIFYGPDGKEISEEEGQFLNENYEDCLNKFLCDDPLEESDPDDLFDPNNELGEEVRAAFREFTKANRG